MSILHNASHVTMLGGTLAAVAPGSTLNISQGNQAGLSGAFKELSDAAAHTALHDSAARFDAPRCHRSTRAKYRDKLELWMLKGEGVFELEGKRLIWLCGGAGAGKSAIMQSVVEQCTQHGVILGSFFFSRTDPSRNYAEVLIPTLAYQVACAFPGAMAVLDPIFLCNPHILRASLQTQAYELLVRPILHLLDLGIIDNASSLRRVFVIDGLDECSDPQKQALIIRVITSMLCDHHIPICFLIASRPEIAISSAFEKERQLREVFLTISLDQDDDAESDIRHFIEGSFADILESHPLRTYIELPWPSLNTVDRLVQKSSGHFIYAATAMKFISSYDEHPGRALEVVEGLEPSRTASPFVELDALYMHILTSAKYTKQVVEILWHRYRSPLSETVEALCYVHGISSRDIPLFLSDVQSLVSLAPNESGQLTITPKHASLADFFQDECRSQTLYISYTAYCVRFLASHFRLLDISPQYSSFCFQPERIGSCSCMHHLVVDLAEGLIHSEDTNLVQSLVSSHTPYDIWNFCVELFAQDTTISARESRAFLAQTMATYMGGLRDSVAADNDALYFDHFKMYTELILDDLNDFVHQKPQYRIIPALLFLGRPSNMLATHQLLHWWGHQFHINPSYRFHFFDPFTNKNFKPEHRAFRAIRSLPQSRLSWGSELAIAMKLVLSRLVTFPWPGPSETLHISLHRQWLKRHKPLKQISMGSPRLSSTLVLSRVLYDARGKFKPVLWKSGSSGEDFNRLCYGHHGPGPLRHSHSKNIGTQALRSGWLLNAIIHYLRKSDCTSDVVKLARRLLPVATKWHPRLMKRARHEMDAYVCRWEESVNCLLERTQSLSINSVD